MATHPSVPSRVTSGHCSGGGLSPVGGSRWPCEDGGPLAPCPSPKASAMCCGSPSPRKPLPVPGAQRDRSKWGLWTEQGRGPLATRGHTPGGARRTGCPQAAPFRSGPVGPAASSPSRQLPAQAGLDRRPPARPGPPQPGCSSFALPPGVRGGAPGQAVAHPPGLLHLLHCLLRADSRSGSAGEAGRDRGGPRAPHPLRPLPAFRRSSSGIRRHRLLEEEPGATLPNAAERLAPGDRGSRRPLAQAASALRGVIRLFSARRTQYRGCLTSASRASSPTSSDTPLGPVCTRSCFRACAVPCPAPLARAPQRGPGRRSSLSHRGLGRV